MKIVESLKNLLPSFAKLMKRILKFKEVDGKIILFNPLDLEYPDMRHHQRWKWLLRGRSKIPDDWLSPDPKWIIDIDDSYLNRLTDKRSTFYTGWNNQELFCKWFNKPIPIIRDRFYFYTFTGIKRIKDTEENIEKLKDICKDIFNNEKWKRYTDVYYNIECGKHKDDSNLHIHALIDFENSNKNFERDFKTRWMKDFREYGLDFKNGGKQFYKGKNVQRIWDDKVSYLRNDDKSVLHQNYRDLSIFEHVE